MLLRSLKVFALTACTAVMSLVGASSASAAVTTTSITNLPSPAHFTYQYDLGDLAAANRIRVSGTSNGTTGDLVDLRCYTSSTNASYSTIRNNIAVASDGSWAGWYEFNDFYNDTCLLRAVPDGASPTPGNPDIAPFPAIRIFTSGFQLNDSSGAIDDYYYYQYGTKGYSDFYSFGDCGIDYMQLATVSDTASTNFHNGAISCDAYGAGTVTPPGGSSRPMIMIDGAYARSPYDADMTKAGAQELSVTFEQDRSTGNLTIRETVPFVKCAPSEASCDSYVSAGVTLERVWKSAGTATEAKLHDAWKSTDGAAHSFDVLLYNYVYGTGAPGWMLPGETAFVQHSSNDLITTTSWRDGAFGFRTVYDFATLAADDPDNPHSFLGYDRRPSMGWFSSQNEAIINYTGTIPAGSSWALNAAFTIASSATKLAAAATPLEDALEGPKVAITAPAASALIEASPTVVSGTASDNIGIASVTVNGVAATVAAGTWTASVPLTAGANKLTVVAKDAAGLEATASVDVTFRQKAFVGTAGKDKITGNDGDNTFDTGAGDDRVECGEGGKDTAKLGGGNDWINCVESYAKAKASKDTIDCGAGKNDVAMVDPFDTVKNCEKVTRVWNGGAKADKWKGTKANDKFNTKGGADNVNCGGGVDQVLLGAGNDTVNCYDAGKNMKLKKKSKDVVNCGAGKKDLAIVDRFDVVKGCEKVIRKA